MIKVVMSLFKLSPILLYLMACAYAGDFGIGEILALAGGIVSELLKFRNLNLKPSALRLCIAIRTIDMPIIFLGQFVIILLHR